MTTEPLQRLNYSCSASGEILKGFQQLNTPLGSFSGMKHLAIHPDIPISSVLSEMHSRDCDVAVLVDADHAPVGIFTKRDLLSRVVIPRINLDLPIRTVMTPEPVVLQSAALGFEAVVAMIRGGFRHVVLVEDGQVAGVVSEHDLFRLQQVSFGQIAANLNGADSLEKIRHSAAEIRNLVEYLFVHGVASEQVTQLISTFNDQLVRRVIDLETRSEDMRGARLCWIIMGSEGRFEQTITTDQDNGIIFDHPATVTADSVRSWLVPIAQRVNNSLADVGFALCKGNVMAGNPDCCLSLAEWQKKIQRWIHEPTPDSLLNVSIFFDFRALHGSVDLADELRTWLSAAAQHQKRFLHGMAEAALHKSPPFSLFSSFLQDNHPDAPNSTDIKQRGVNVFADAARIYALATGCTATKTCARLRQAAEILRWPETLVGAWIDAFRFLQGIRIRHQHHLQYNGIKTHNCLDLCSLNSLEQKVCAEAFRQASKLQKQLENDFITNLMCSGVIGA